MEDPIDNLHELEEFEDTLSLRDLPIHEREETELDIGYRNSVSDQDFSFEFSSTTAHSEPELYTQFDPIMFPRKITKPVKGSFIDPEINSLFPMNSPRSFGSNNNSSKSPFAFSKSNSRASTSGSAMGIGRPVISSRAIAGKRHGVLIGLARMPPRMELSEIKKRQSKRSPPPMFPVAEVGGAGRVHSGLLGPWRHRSLLLTVLAKASRVRPIRGLLRARSCISISC